MKENILLGFEAGTGKPVFIPLHHLAIFGMTQLSGKCLTGDDEIQLASGGRITIEEACKLGTSLDVLSLDDETLKIVPDSVVVFESQVKPVFDVEMKDGRHVKLSSDHPLRDVLGWKPLSYFRAGDYVAVPRALPVRAVKDVEDSVLIILAHMLAECSMSGTLSHHSTGFTSANQVIVTDLDDALRQHNLALHQVGEIDYRIHQLEPYELPFSKPRRVGSAGCPSYGYWRRFSEVYGLLQVKSRQKEIPTFVFELKEEKVALFLNRLFGDDGVYTTKTGLAGYSSTSTRLLSQVRSLLLRFGIRTFISHVSEITVARQDTATFFERIGFFGRSICDRAMNHTGTYDIVPERVPRLKKYKDHWILSGPRSGYPSRPTLHTYAEYSGNKTLRKLADSDIYWDKVKTVTYLGTVQTYDATTNRTGNLIVNDVFVHNTTALEALINRSGLKAIAFITKRGESGFARAHLVAPYYKPRADWQFVEGLVNVALGEKVKFEPGMRVAIMRVSKGRKDLREVLKAARDLEKAEKREFMRSVYEKLVAYLEIVVPELDKWVFVDRLSLQDGINVMDISAMRLETQHIVIASTIDYILGKLDHTVVVVPEAWESLPQQRMTPVKWVAAQFIRKGAAIGNYMFLDSQDIAGIEKTYLRQCDNWLMGRMKEAHEVERIIKQLLGTKVKAEEIQTLPLGHFYAVIGTQVKKVYVLPSGVPEEVGVEVSMGDKTPEAVRDKYMMRELLQPPSPIPGASPEASLEEGLENILPRVETLEKEVAALERDNG